MAYLHMILLAALATMGCATTCGSESIETCSGKEHLDSHSVSAVSLLQTDLAMRSAKAHNTIDSKDSKDDSDDQMWLVAPTPCDTKMEPGTVVDMSAAQAQTPCDTKATGPAPEKAPAPAPEPAPAAPAPEKAAPAPKKEDKKPCDATSSGKRCLPQCRYECTDPKCDETCTPTCLAPECQTRCPKMSDASFQKTCKMTCQEPKCENQCPKTGCGNSECALCKTVCHKPECSVTCAPDCTTVCKQPKCTWDCAKPTDCPKPECKMVCEDAPGCADFSDSPLGADMTVVDSFAPPAAALLQQDGGKGQTLSVDVVHTVALPGTSELQLVRSKVSLPYES